MGPRGMNARDASARLRLVSSPVERVVDAALRFVAPRTALIRAHRRLMERDSDYRENWLGSDGLMAARGYKGAQSPTNGTPWLNASNRAADSELILDLATLRNRCRQLERDDSLGSGVIRTRVRQVVGSGLRPQAATKRGRELNDLLEALWAERQGSLFPAEGRVSFAQAQRVMYARLLVDGEVFVSRAKTSPTEPVWFELIEADRVDTPMDARPVDPEGRIVNGVEKDKHGRVVAYWVSKQHPGELVHVKTVGKPFVPIALNKESFNRVPVEGIRHLRYRVTRPGQTRGVPLMHACMQDFHDLDLLTLALLKKAQVAACLSLFITSDQAIADLFEVTAEDYGYQLDQQIEPGMMFKLFPGEKVESVIPGFAVPEVEPVQKGIAKRIGAACEMSPEAVLHDWGGTNYSAARTVQIEDNRSYDTDRADLADQGLTWMWGEVLTDAQLMGDRRVSGATAADFGAVRWVGDARPWVDPQAESAAILARKAMGLTCKRDEATALGKDWEELQEQQLTEEKSEADKRKALKLPEAVPMDAKGKAVPPPPPDEPPAPKNGAQKKSANCEARTLELSPPASWENRVKDLIAEHKRDQAAPVNHVTVNVPAQPSPTVNVPITVESPEPLPPQPAPVVEPARVHVDVHVPAQPTPIVKVEAPVTVNVPEQKPEDREIKLFRNLAGDVTGGTSKVIPQGE